MLCEIYLARLENKYVFPTDPLMASHRLHACTVNRTTLKVAIGIKTRAWDKREDDDDEKRANCEHNFEPNTRYRPDDGDDDERNKRDTGCCIKK